MEKEKKWEFHSEHSPNVPKVLFCISNGGYNTINTI